MHSGRAFRGECVCNCSCSTINLHAFCLSIGLHCSVCEFAGPEARRFINCRPQIKKTCKPQDKGKPATMSEDYDLTIIETMEANSPESSTNELDSPPSLEMRSLDSEYLPEEKVHCNNHPDSKMTVALQHQSRKLWKQFDTVGTEMIVTRRGRYVV